MTALICKGCISFTSPFKPALQLRFFWFSLRTPSPAHALLLMVHPGTSHTLASGRQKWEAASCPYDFRKLQQILPHVPIAQWVWQPLGASAGSTTAKSPVSRHPSTQHRAGWASGSETGRTWDVTVLALKSLLPWFGEEQGGAALPPLHQLRSHWVWAGAAKFPRVGLLGGGREEKWLHVDHVWVQSHDGGKELTPNEDTNAVSCWQPHHEWSNAQSYRVHSVSERLALCIHDLVYLFTAIHGAEMSRPGESHHGPHLLTSSTAPMSWLHLAHRFSCPSSQHLVSKWTTTEKKNRNTQESRSGLARLKNPQYWFHGNTHDVEQLALWDLSKVLC